ncbi:hypothetical protein GMORB2_5181 [Geosmithia morbida]|uniref:Uncharacterized protein n=1 Tax=Geosmithia morbida TaxID=1094350 RepID=A0A9P4YX80_9HYPO|nr:uncharacterized protein GMORB2_5181 [Geosmithia morbida]KAF4124515.1 hypothetical protein GMORB2_5181 [Geosmithia morbida]
MLETLHNGQEHLIKLRMDILDAVNLDICVHLYDDLEGDPAFASQGTMAANDDASSSFSKVPSRTLSSANFYDNGVAQQGPQPVHVADSSSVHGGGGGCVSQGALAGAVTGPGGADLPLR